MLFRCRRGMGRRTALRPKMELSDANVGWKTVLARRKLVPDQKASRAEPPRSLLMMGRATARVVASRATAMMITSRARKARRNSRVGRKAAGCCCFSAGLPEAESAGSAGADSVSVEDMAKIVGESLSLGLEGRKGKVWVSRFLRGGVFVDSFPFVWLRVRTSLSAPVPSYITPGAEG